MDFHPISDPDKLPEQMPDEMKNAIIKQGMESSGYQDQIKQMLTNMSAEDLFTLRLMMHQICTHAPKQGQILASNFDGLVAGALTFDKGVCSDCGRTHDTIPSMFGDLHE